MSRWLIAQPTSRSFMASSPGSSPHQMVRCKFGTLHDTTYLEIYGGVLFAVVTMGERCDGHCRLCDTLMMMMMMMMMPMLESGHKESSATIIWSSVVVEQRTIVNCLIPGDWLESVLCDSFNAWHCYLNGFYVTYRIKSRKKLEITKIPGKYRHSRKGISSGLDCVMDASSVNELHVDCGCTVLCDNPSPFM